MGRYCKLMAGVLLLLGLAAAVPARISHADALPSELVYRLAFGEVRLGEATVKLQNSGARYRIAMESRSVGPLDGVLTWTSYAESTGRARDGTLLPERHDRRSTWRGDKRYLRMRYRDGDKVDVEAEPPEEASEIRRILAQAGKSPMDPYSAALKFIERFDATRRCDDAATVFDGRKLYAVELRDVERTRLRRDRPWAYAGDAVRCNLITSRIDRDLTERRDYDPDDHRHVVLIWFGQVTPTAWAPVRIELPLPLGRLVARLATPAP